VVGFILDRIHPENSPPPANKSMNVYFFFAIIELECHFENSTADLPYHDIWHYPCVEANI
jgi:hypothetical protein